MLDPTTIVNHPENIVVEYPNGDEVPVQKIYYVGGRAECFKVLIRDFEREKLKSEIEDYKADYKILEGEKKDAERELKKAEDELEELEEKHEKELSKIENSLESAEELLGIKTSERFIHYRISEFARKINEKFNSLEEEREHFKRQIKELTADNTALAWNIDQLTKQHT